MDVYFTFQTFDIDENKIFPKQRRDEISFVKNEELKLSKKTSWRLLSLAIEQSFRKSIDSVKFKKEENGKWTAEGFWFSVSHTKGFTVVAVSENSCGVDVENVEAFLKKCADKPFIDEFAKKINAKTAEPLHLLKEWTAKESIYKQRGTGAFIPSKIQVDNGAIKYYKVEEYLIAITALPNEPVNFYRVCENEEIVLETAQCLYI